MENPLNRSGFTLIELAIVMVVIGLIVGGILVGRDLIEAAGIRATVSDVEKLKTAIRTFQTKYNCLPGDCPNASDFFAQSTICPSIEPTGTCNGNGDGKYQWIEGYGGESTWAADQLIKAQLVQIYAGGYGSQLLRPPDGKANGISYIFTNDLYVNGPDVAVNGRDGNTITMGSKSGGCLSGVVEKASNAEQVDIKMDDGHPSGGAVFGLTGSEYGNDFGAAGCGPPDNSCTVGGEYNNADNTALCRMIFYW